MTERRSSLPRPDQEHDLRDHFMIPILLFLLRRRPFESNVLQELNIRHPHSFQGVHDHVAMVSYSENEKMGMRTTRVGGSVSRRESREVVGSGKC